MNFNWAKNDVLHKVESEVLQFFLSSKGSLQIFIRKDQTVTALKLKTLA